MRSTLAPGERPLFRVGSSKKGLLAMPEPVIRHIGMALDVAQLGGTDPSTRCVYGEVPEGALCAALFPEEVTAWNQDCESRY